MWFTKASVSVMVPVCVRFGVACMDGVCVAFVDGVGVACQEARGLSLVLLVGATGKDRRLVRKQKFCLVAGKR